MGAAHRTKKSMLACMLACMLTCMLTCWGGEGMGRAARLEALVRCRTTPNGTPNASSQKG
eukprot:CAMPEP_0181247596 /NCGR_PEP_ID=MMETSP1096-20121128/44699_1 /TAXON_ID=156174 ORGANISM="Chrysochromulina ericina, Strain CCMP281" /NCGR_SAMPLE_ID=MMETSP1096 /ASSEMBLY_ACC=CAM_ASM_000453 /LENGTH=59 /DNA_ID=CAMNT_0023344665 /DNA_START=383 /DNA_END=562 /DNA_ORIENTATION=-